MSSTQKSKKSVSKEILELALYVLLGYLIAFGMNKGFGYALNTTYPIVAVVSKSMEHSNPETYEQWFLQRNFTFKELEERPFHNGMNKGDIVVVKGVPFEKIKVNDVIVYKFPKREPVIHRVVEARNNSLMTKGDNNYYIDQENAYPAVEKENVMGKAVLHIPLFGWVKIIFMEMTGAL